MVRLLTFGARDQEKQNNMLFLIRMLTGAFTFSKVNFGCQLSNAY